MESILGDRRYFLGFLYDWGICYEEYLFSFNLLKCCMNK